MARYTYTIPRNTKGEGRILMIFTKKSFLWTVACAFVGLIVGYLPIGVIFQHKQKLAFSVSIFHRPKIVFLDEPTGGVDPATRRQFWELIYQAADEGITVFVTTHFMDEAEYCDRISIMVDGVIRALDTPGELKRQFNATTMDDVFQQLARQAVRTAD